MAEPDERTAVLQALVDSFNEEAEYFRLLDHGPVEDGGKLLESLDAPFREYVHVHEPWDRAFVVWWEDEPARIECEFLDLFTVTPSMNKPSVDRQNLYAEKSAGERGLVPRCRYEREGEETAELTLEPYPVEGADHLFTLIPDEAVPVPEITLQTWDLETDQPAIDAERYFDRQDRVRVTESGVTGTVEGVGGRTVSIDLDHVDEYTLERYRPDALECIGPE